MAKAKPKIAPAGPTISDRLEQAQAKLDRDGAVKLSDMGRTADRPALLAELVRRGFEVTKSGVRKPLKAQLASVLSDGAFIPLKSVAAHVAGSTAAEAKQAVLALVADGLAKLVLRGSEEVVVPKATAVLSRDELMRFGDVAKFVAKAAKTKNGASLLRSDLVDALTRALPGGAWNEGVRAPRTELARGTSARADEQARRAQLERLLAAIEVTRDVNSGLSFVPTIIAQLETELSSEAASSLLVAAARDGLLELRPEGGINRLSKEELSLCPEGPQGTRLSWARRTEHTAP